MDKQAITAKALHEALERGNDKEVKALLEEAKDLLARQGDLQRAVEEVERTLEKRVLAV